MGVRCGGRCDLVVRRYRYTLIVSFLLYTPAVSTSRRTASVGKGVHPSRARVRSAVVVATVRRVGRPSIQFSFHCGSFHESTIPTTLQAAA